MRKCKPLLSVQKITYCLFLIQRDHNFAIHFGLKVRKFSSMCKTRLKKKKKVFFTLDSLLNFLAVILVGVFLVCFLRSGFWLFLFLIF